MLGEIDKSLKPHNLKLSLCKPNKTKIANIKHSHLETLSVKLGKIDELSFSLPFHIDINNELKRTPYIDKVKKHYKIKVEYNDSTQWFLIAEEPTKIFNENTDELQVSAYSLGYELKNSRIRKYSKESLNCTQILTDILTDTNWVAGYVEPKFDNMYRQFNENGINILNFVFKIAETFGAIVDFDTINRAVNIYDSNTNSEDKGFSIGYGKLLKSLNLNEDSSNFATRLSVYGKGDLSIQKVNPSGKTYIEDFSYFIGDYDETVTDETNDVYTVNQSSDYMSDELCHALLKYEKLLNSKESTQDVAESGTTSTNIAMTSHGLVTGDFIVNRDRRSEVRKVTVVDADNIVVESIEGQSVDDNIDKYSDGTFGKLLFEKEELQEVLTTKNNELFQLNTELKTILDNIELKKEEIENSSGSTTTLESELDQLETDRDNKISEINSKENEITSTETDIFNKQTSIDDLRNEVNKSSNFTTSELEELNYFTIETEWKNENYTEQHERQLYEDGWKKLKEINTPSLNIQVDMVNLLEIIDEQREWHKVVLGDYITIKHKKLNVDIKAQITEINYDFEDGNISLTISNLYDMKTDEEKFLNALKNNMDETKNLQNQQYNWDEIATNFLSRNDRISVKPANPIVANDGTAIDHVENTDGSVDISFKWSYNTSNSSEEKYRIDGFIIYAYSSRRSDKYVFGSTIAKEDLNTVNANKFSYAWKGVSANKYWSFGIQAYRKVDTDVNSDGIVASDIIQPTDSTEDPYLPNSNVAFKGDLTGDVKGTIGGTPYDEVNKNPVTFVVGNEDAGNHKKADFYVPSGSTSAQTAINEAIYTLGSLGGRIALLNGNYKVDGTIDLADNMILEGSGTGTIIQVDSSVGSNLNVISASSCSNVIIRNMKIDGSRVPISSTSPNITAINFDNVRFSSIDSVSLNYFTSRGIHLLKSSNNKIVNNTTIDCSNHIRLNESLGNVINSNSMSMDSLNGIGLYLYKLCNDNLISDNHMDGLSTGILSLLGGEENLIVDNTCINNIEYGIWLAYLNRNTVKGNKCANNWMSGIFIENSSDNVINSNICINNSFRPNYPSNWNTYSNIKLKNSSRNNIQTNTIRNKKVTSGKVVSATSSTVVLDDTTSNDYTNLLIKITEGTGSDGQERIIVSYDTSTKEATLDFGWWTTPDSTSTYELWGHAKYGIEISDSNCKDNIVTNNSITNSGITGDFADSGTNTITTAGNS